MTDDEAAAGAGAVPGGRPSIQTVSHVCARDVLILVMRVRIEKEPAGMSLFESKTYEGVT